MTPSRSEIRPELQALRAVAVILVVAFHIFPSAVPGGYIGVDVFFVISGFLITSHLVREVVRTGTVSVTHFWARRVRRLLPAAFTVLIASAVATLILLPRSVWEQTLQEISAASVYGVNWLLAANSVDYLAADNKPSIVQHYWSLAVEEQFYVVWPLLILVAIAIATWAVRHGRVGGPNGGKASLVAIATALGAVALASLLFSIEETARSQPFAYFITPTRAWEFAAGGLLAMTPTRALARVPKHLALGIRVAASWLGLALILFSAFTFSDSSPFPGSIALIPVVGTVLMIWAGDVPSAVAPTAVAGFAPLQLIGDLSYSIYLWHWPLILLYPHIRGHAPELKGGLLIFGLSVALAWVTKYFVEDPVRRRRFWTTSRRRSFALAGALMAVTLALVGTGELRLQQDLGAEQQRIAAGVAGQLECFGADALADRVQCPKPFAVPAMLDTAAARHDLGIVFRTPGCVVHADSPDTTSCSLGDPNGSVGVAVIGNSHAAVLAAGLAWYARHNDWRLDTYIRLDCLGIATEQVSGVPSPACVGWTREVLERLVSDPATDVVVFQSYIGATPPAFKQPDRLALQDAMKATWGRLLATGKHVIVISDPPGVRPDIGPECIGAHLDVYDPCSRPVWKVSLDNAMLQAASATPGVTAIDLRRYFCDRKLCHALVGGVVVYFDSHHLTETYSVTLARHIGPEIDALLGR